MRLSIFALALVACQGTTGGGLITFTPSAAGPADATGGGTLVFDNNAGFHVTLTQAHLHIGALYLNEARPLLGAQETGCLKQGTYVGQVLGAVDVDALSPAPQPFGAGGVGIARAAKTAELWLTGGDIDAATDSTVVARVAGEAVKGALTYAFEGEITIGENRVLPIENPAFPGSKPICKQRIVGPLPIEITLTRGVRLLVRVDPRVWLANLDFAGLIPEADGRYRIADAQGDPASDAFFAGVRARGAYRFESQPQ